MEPTTAADWMAVADERLADAEVILEELEIVSFVGYSEAIATSDKMLLDPEILQNFNPVAKWLESFLGN